MYGKNASYLLSIRTFIVNTVLWAQFKYSQRKKRLFRWSGSSPCIFYEEDLRGFAGENRKQTFLNGVEFRIEFAKRSKRNVKNNLTRGNPKPLESPFIGKQGTNESLCGIKDLRMPGYIVAKTDPAHSIRIDYKWNTTLPFFIRERRRGRRGLLLFLAKNNSKFREHD
ncbi:hypothetical protein CEXT_156091 [Caerostris extrusa]|uniref:Uncharacterized protein n=1 Tax=Caerostris extrusa TaxID=172846 RepID=A0AAV4QDB7_CAEEX|nr:hypothetical protein CEXT_156091 [Caerostris extrusa]